MIVKMQRTNAWHKHRPWSREWDVLLNKVGPRGVNSRLRRYFRRKERRAQKRFLSET